MNQESSSSTNGCTTKNVTIPLPVDFLGSCWENARMLTTDLPASFPTTTKLMNSLLMHHSESPLELSQTMLSLSENRRIALRTANNYTSGTGIATIPNLSNPLHLLESHHCGEQNLFRLFATNTSGLHVLTDTYSTNSQGTAGGRRRRKHSFGNLDIGGVGIMTNRERDGRGSPISSVGSLGSISPRDAEQSPGTQRNRQSVGTSSSYGNSMTHRSLGGGMIEGKKRHLDHRRRRRQFKRGKGGTAPPSDSLLENGEWGEGELVNLGLTGNYLSILRTNCVPRKAASRETLRKLGFRLMKFRMEKSLDTLIFELTEDYCCEDSSSKKTTSSTTIMSHKQMKEICSNWRVALECVIDTLARQAGGSILQSRQRTSALNRRKAGLQSSKRNVSESMNDSFPSSSQVVETPLESTSRRQHGSTNLDSMSSGRSDMSSSGSSDVSSLTLSSMNRLITRDEIQLSSTEREAIQIARLKAKGHTLCTTPGIASSIASLLRTKQQAKSGSDNNVDNCSNIDNCSNEKNGIGDCLRIYGVIQVITEACFLRNLIRDLFHPFAATLLTNSHRKHLCEILVLVASVKEKCIERQNEERQRSDHRGEVKRKTIVDHFFQTKFFYDESTQHQLSARIDLIFKASEQCGNNGNISQTVSDPKRFRSCQGVKVLANGFLFWAKKALDPECIFSTSSGAKAVANVMDILVRDIAKHHPDMQCTVFKIISDFLINALTYESDQEVFGLVNMQRSAVDALIGLMILPNEDDVSHQSLTLPVLNYFYSLVSRHRQFRLDEPLIRHFISRVLLLSSQPYSIPFINVFLAIMAAPVAIAALEKSDKSTSQRRSLLQFLQFCKLQKAKKTIHPHSCTWLNQLSKRFR
eukprot:g3759.t1